jgi:hypothetical protein
MIERSGLLAFLHNESLDSDLVQAAADMRRCLKSHLVRILWAIPPLNGSICIVI